MLSLTRSTRGTGSSVNNNPCDDVAANCPDVDSKSKSCVASWGVDYFNKYGREDGPFCPIMECPNCRADCYNCTPLEWYDYADCCQQIKCCNCKTSKTSSCTECHSRYCHNNPDCCPDCACGHTNCDDLPNVHCDNFFSEDRGECEFMQPSPRQHCINCSGSAGVGVDYCWSKLKSCILKCIVGRLALDILGKVRGAILDDVAKVLMEQGARAAASFIRHVLKDWLLIIKLFDWLKVATCLSCCRHSYNRCISNYNQRKCMVRGELISWKKHCP